MADSRILDARIGGVGKEVSIAYLKGGIVRYGPFPSKTVPTDDLELAVLSPTLVRGIGIDVSLIVPSYDPAFDRCHFEVLVSLNPNAVVTSEPAEADVFARYFSEEPGGWYLEMDSVYALPTAGANVDAGSDQIGKTVRFLAYNIDLDPSVPFYVFWRTRRYSSGSFVVGGMWIGHKVKVLRSRPLNTGDKPTSNQAVDLPLSLVSWPGGQLASVEVYAGPAPSVAQYLAGTVPYVYRNSATNRSGFRWFDGTSMELFPIDGLPDSASTGTAYLITNPIKSETPFFVVYRTAWTGGGSDWTAHIYVPTDAYELPGQDMNVCLKMDVQADQLPNRYHAQVIIGTSYDLRDYFPGGDTSLLLPDMAAPDLLEFGYSWDIADRPNFSVFDGDGLVPISYAGLDNTRFMLISYISKAAYNGDELLYAFWRYDYDASFSSSSSWSSSSWSSSSNSSSSESMTPTLTPTLTVTATPTLTPSNTPTVTPTQTPSPTSTPTPTLFVVCPSDTDSCAAGYTVVIAGGTGWASQSGGTGELYPWDAINGTWNLAKSGNTWTVFGWNGTALTSPHGNHVGATITLRCADSPSRWLLSAQVNDEVGAGMGWQKTIGALCPPDGVYDVYVGNCYSWCPSGCTPPTVSAS